MKRTDRSPQPTIGPPADGGDAPTCGERPDLTRWATRGGPLPSSLAAHVRGCPQCAEHVRRVNHVSASFTLLKTQAVPAGLMYHANQRALRMLRRAERASAEAHRALRARPGLNTWQKAKLHAARGSMSAAAALLILVTRVGIVGGMEQTRTAGEALAKTHWKNHIDPNNEWLDSEGMTWHDSAD